MKQTLRLLAFGLCWIVASAHAEMMTDTLLQKDYDNCMGGSTADKDPQRAQYCACVREGMKKWTTDEYGAAATEAQQSKVTPDQIANLAKTCIAEVLH